MIPDSHSGGRPINFGSCSRQFDLLQKKKHDGGIILPWICVHLNFRISELSKCEYRSTGGHNF
jgi:hypothetical protein